MAKTYDYSLTVIFGMNCMTRTFHYETEELCKLHYSNIVRIIGVPARSVEIHDSTGITQAFQGMAVISVSWRKHDEAVT